MLIISTQNFPPRAGGIETLMHTLARGLSEAGETLAVFADHKHEAGEKAFDLDQPYPVFRYGGIRPLRRRRKARAIRDFCSSHASGSPLQLITDSWKSLELIDTSPFSAVLCLVHGTEIPPAPSPRRRARIARALAGASRILPNSHYTAGLVLPYVAAAEKIQVMHPGLDIPEVDPSLERDIGRRIGAAGPVLITVARLEKRKGHKAIIEALPEIVREFPLLLYVIVGEGSERRALTRCAAGLGVERHVLFTGRLTGPDKNAWLANSTLFVMPGSVVGRDVEGFGIAYIEAAYFGKPAVACHAGGAAEAVLHGRTGLVCDPGDPVQLRESILRLLRDEDYRRELGIAARERARGLLWKHRIAGLRKLLAVRPAD